MWIAYFPLLNPMTWATELQDVPLAGFTLVARRGGRVSY